MTAPLTAHLTLVALAMGDGSDRKPPTEFRIFPMGLVETSKGTFIFDDRSAEMCMAEFEVQGNELFIDYDHRSLSDEGPPDSGKAAGWFALELREDGLWAVNVRWTPAAAAALEAGEWRYFSPAFFTDEERRICCLINIALTNNPATRHMTPLVAASARWARVAARKDTMSNAILVALGLAETASEADALGATQALVSLGRDLRALTGKASDAEALATVKAWQESHTALSAAQTELTALRAAEESRQVDDLIRLGREQGKVNNLNEAKVRALGKPTAVQAFLDAAIAPPANASPAPKDELTALGKTWEQLSTAEKHRLYNDKPELYRALKADFDRRNAGR